MSQKSPEFGVQSSASLNGSKNRRVLAALSGGVDSAVAAAAGPPNMAQFGDLCCRSHPVKGKNLTGRPLHAAVALSRFGKPLG